MMKSTHRHGVTLFLVTMAAFASMPLFADQPRGWKWYNEPKVKTAPVKREKPPVPKNQTQTIMSSTEQMQWFHKTYDEIKNDAFIHSKDEEKLNKLMKMNKFINDRTSETTMTFKKVLLNNPELSYLKDRPAEFAARKTYHSLERKKKVEAVKKLKSEGWGFFFIYDGLDELSKTLAPSIQEFADIYQLELLGISRDGTFIESIRNNKHNQGKLDVAFAPALILVNPKTHEMKPLAYGFVSQNELLGRFFNVATDYQTPDF